MFRPLFWIQRSQLSIFKIWRHCRHMDALFVHPQVIIITCEKDGRTVHILHPVLDVGTIYPCMFCERSIGRHDCWPCWTICPWEKQCMDNRSHMERIEWTWDITYWTNPYRAQINLDIKSHQKRNSEVSKKSTYTVVTKLLIWASKFLTNVFLRPLTLRKKIGLKYRKSGENLWPI